MGTELSDRLGANGIYGHGGSSRPPAIRRDEDSSSAARFFYTAKADVRDRWHSKHPTVKPISLISYLVKLVCPPGGLFLDPFAGSGTGGAAAINTGRNAILIEREPDYVADIRERLAAYRSESSLPSPKRGRRRETGGLFDLLEDKPSDDIVKQDEPLTNAVAVPESQIIEFAPPAPEIQSPTPELPAPPPLALAPAPRPRIEVTPRLAFTATVKREPLADPFLAHHAETLRAAGGGMLTFSDPAWDYESKTAIGLDVECFANFFLVALRRFATGAVITFEMSDRCALDAEGLQRAVGGSLVVTFNGNAYDLPMIALALSGADNVRLKEASDRIVGGAMRPWEAERELGVRLPKWNHIDLMEPNPSVRQSLKMLHARLHGRFIVDLPYEPGTYLADREKNVATLYCLNDLDATEGLWFALREPIELRYALGREYGIDLRSKSDSQIGEAIVKKRVEQTLGRRIDRPAPQVSRFGYDPPDFIQFQDPQLVDLLERLRSVEFVADPAGKVKGPEFLNDLMIEIGGNKYSCGQGGLHSAEAHRALHSNDEQILIDIDVASQYPNIILKLGLYPPAMGPTFLDVYREIVRGRLEAKRKQQQLEKEIAILEAQLKEAERGWTLDNIRMKIAELKVERDRWKAKSDGEKVSSVGVFGKLGSSYSVLYAPHLLLAITLTGQLSLLTLIEKLEASGMSVRSSNTDGLVISCPLSKESEFTVIVNEWEQMTGFQTERTDYRAIYNSSVNSYLAIKLDGTVKRKGLLGNPWAENDLRSEMSKNPQMYVLSDAALAFIRDGVPVEQTIRECYDPRAFITVINVKSGGVWRGTKLGRVVRFYWSTDGDQISYADGSRKVAKTEGSRPLMELTDTMPPDVDYARYVAEAEKLLADLGINAGGLT